MDKLFSQFICGLDCPVRELAGWQSPRALPMKWHREEFPQCQFVFLAIRRNANSNCILRHITTQSAMKFVPPTKDCPPIRIRLALDDGMMDAVHARCDEDQI